jgi:hypothetical protein
MTSFIFYPNEDTHFHQGRYDQFVANSPQGTLFSTSWWLDAVAPGVHHILTIKKGGNIQAAWPFVLNWTKLTGLVISMPPLTPWLGILYAPSETLKIAKQLAREKDLSMELIEQLPAFSSLYAHTHRNFTYWSPFYWKEFTQTTRYTYILENISNLDLVWRNLRENIRGDIRKARKQNIVVDVTEDIERFLHVHKLTFQRQNKSLPYSTDLVRRVDQACAMHGVRKIFVARDQRGQDHAVAYIVWDNKSVYYLMGGGNPELRSSGATSLVLWEAIQFASTVSNIFDFEGSMIEPVERFFRAFGAIPCPYSVINKINSPIIRVVKSTPEFSNAIQATRDIIESCKRVFRKTP